MVNLEKTTPAKETEPLFRKRVRFDPVFLLILILAAVFFLYQLGQRPFWQDEAETACLAKNVLKYGKPLAFDGVNLISQEEQREFGEDYVWRWSPWLQIYVSAASFKLGGFTTAAGRLPFALAGFLCVIMVYMIINRFFANPALARISAVLLTLCVPFLVYSRQLRYYGIAALLVMISLYAFRQNWQKKTLPAATLVVSLALLFYANYILYLSYCVSLAVAALIIYRNEIPVVRTVVLGVLNVLLIIPGVFISKMGSQAGIVSPLSFFTGFSNYMQYLMQFLLPLPVIIAFIIVWTRIIIKYSPIPQDPEKRFVLFLTIIVIVNVIVLAIVPQIFVRYLAHLYPICMIILGYVILDTVAQSRVAGVILFLVLALTNWIYIVPMDLFGITYRPTGTDAWMLVNNNFPIRLFWKDVTSDFPDVNETAIEYLNANAKPGDVVVTTYGDLPLQFYTKCQVFGGLQNRLPPEGVLPDWVIVRPFLSLDRSQQLYASDKYVRFQLDLDRDYDIIILPGPAEPFGNRPDPAWHRFMPLQEPYEKLKIYRKKTGEG